MRVIWSPSALRQIVRIFDYLEDFNPQAAAEVMAALIETGDGLLNFPYRGRPVRNSDIREVITSYPYIIRYPPDNALMNGSCSGMKLVSPYAFYDSKVRKPTPGEGCR